jgi:hypothetical protein
MGKKRGAYSVLMRKPVGRRPLGKPIRKWKDDIKIDLQQVVWRSCTGSMWFRIGFCECGNGTSNSIKCEDVFENLLAS